MKGYRYLENVTTLKLDREACVGCGMCVTVCPHRVFVLRDGKAKMVDRDLCMECGACATNCPVDAVSVNPGVGCAAAIIHSWLKELKLVRDSGDGGKCC